MPDRVNALVAFVRELTRRRVVHALVVYTGAAFLFLEASGNLIDALHLPETLWTACAVAVVLGVPITAVVSWAYEWTPDGLRRVARPTGPPSLRRQVAWWVVVVALFSGGVALALAGRPSPPAGPGAGPDAHDHGPDAGHPVLAVLPFETAGAAPELAALARGLEAELETVLAGSFTMRWRRAVRPLLERGLPVDSIAEVLDVDYLVQAQVARVGPTPEVLVQLADARTMTVLGSESVTARAEDPLGVLEELTRGMEDVLRPTVGRDVRLRTWSLETGDSVAYRLRWLARERWERALALPDERMVAELEAVDSLLVRVLDRDPDWREPLLARARLAAEESHPLYALGRRDELPALYDRGLAVLERALAAEPEDPEALALRGRLGWRRAWMLRGEEGRGERVDAAEQDLRLALAYDPGNAVAAAALSELLFLDRGQWEEAYHLGATAYRLDAYQDTWGQIVYITARAAFEMGDDEEALRWCREGLRRDPDAPYNHACVLEVLAWGDATPDTDEAWRRYHALVGEPPDPGFAAFYAYFVSATLARAGLPDSARAVLARTESPRGAGTAEAPASAPPSPSSLWLESAVRFRLGDTAEARRLYQTLLASRPDLAVQMAPRRVLRAFLQEGSGGRLPG